MIKTVEMYEQHPYQRRTPEQLKVLAQDHVDHKIVSTEGMHPNIVAITFPSLGQTMQLAKIAAEDGGAALVMQSENPDMVRAAIRDAKAMFQEFKDNKAAMFFQHTDRQVKGTMRAAMVAGVPKEHRNMIETLPMFLNFQYLDEEDTDRFCDLRDALLLAKTEKELGVEPGATPLLGDTSSILEVSPSEKEPN